MGRPADQELLALEGDADDPRSSSAGRHDADRGVPLPAARPRPDVGGLAEPGREPRHPGPPRTSAASTMQPRRPDASRASSPGRTATRPSTPVEGVLSSIPLSELVRRSRPAAAGRGARRRRAPPLPGARPRRADHVGASSPSPTTGSTSTTPEPGPAASRTSAPGARAWCSPARTCLGVEYFCFEGDEIWEMSDERGGRAGDQRARPDRPDRPGQRGRRRQGQGAEGVPDVRPRATTRRSTRSAPTSPASRTSQTFGRNGLHRYNNQDHSMWTAILATLNLLDGAELRRLVGQHRGRVPRGGRAVESALDVDLIPAPTE